MKCAPYDPEYKELANRIRMCYNNKNDERSESCVKCPVCDNVNTSMVCPNCGFDSSRDYGKYPTFGTVGRVTTASALRKQWQEKQQPVEHPAVQPELSIPHRKKSKLLPLLIAAAFALTLGLGVWIGINLGGGIVSEERWQTNVLKADYHTFAYAYVYGTDIRRNWVNSVTFLDSLRDAPKNAIDVSVKGDGSVKMWFVLDGIAYDLFYAADGGINGREACSGMFSNYYNLQSINFGGNLHTDEVSDMSYMFYDCRVLTSLDLHDFDTSNLKNTYNMFTNCPAGDDWQHRLR